MDNNIERLGERWPAFPAVSELGRYEYFSQSIHMPAYEQRHWATASGKGNASATVDFYTTLAHELTHWLDHTTTLWGRKTLVGLYDAINARAAEIESELWRVVAARSHISRMVATRYYMSMRLTLPVDKPWRWQLSSGYAYTKDGKPQPERPIAFARFTSASATGEKSHFARVPITISSLFELNAVAAELSTLDVLAKHTPGAAMEAAVSAHLKSISDNLFNPNQVLYTAAAHTFANVVKTSDLLVAYDMGAALANIALNLPSACYNLLNIPDEFKEDWKGRYQFFIENCDPGFAFLVMLYAAPKLKDWKRSKIEWIETTLTNAGQGNLDFLAAETTKESSQVLIGHLKGALTSRLVNTLDLGHRNYEKRQFPAANSVLAESLFHAGAESLELLPVVLGDEFVCRVGNKPADDIFRNDEDWKKWIEAAWDIDEELEEFEDACIA